MVERTAPFSPPRRGHEPPQPTAVLTSLRSHGSLRSPFEHSSASLRSADRSLRSSSLARCVAARRPRQRAPRPIPRGRERVPAPRAGRATRGRAGAVLLGGNERGCPLDPSRTMQAPQGAKRLRSAASVPRAQRAERRKSQPAQRATRVSRTVFRNPDGRAGRGFLHNCGSSSSNSCS